MARCNRGIPHGIKGRDWMGLVGVLAGLTVLMMGGTALTAQANRPKVLTTVAPLTNIVKNIGGPHIDLHGLIPGGTDSHTFEPAPSDIRYISEADVIILNGLDLEVPTEKLALANKRPGAQLLKLGDQTISPQEYVFDRSFPHSAGHPNPHLWMNPLYAARYAELARDVLATLDPTHATAYQERARLYTTTTPRAGPRHRHGDWDDTPSASETSDLP